ncbi:hypothetical protein DFH07DRAFT_767668 [Mycena maculata]|uniref:Uncharacterized protein n=1 Tax=Mycena maculata TaxID=230809 RepID=A0AAD7NTC7_9AGAR|nr:hypothetical protein DFH07DRAFT_767668 [Mycena maculata]
MARGNLLKDQPPGIIQPPPSSFEAQKPTCKEREGAWGWGGAGQVARGTREWRWSGSRKRKGMGMGQGWREESQPFRPLLYEVVRRPEDRDIPVALFLGDGATVIVTVA